MRWHPTIALSVVLAAGLACGGDESGSTGPTTGSLEVLLGLTGEDLDPDGCQVALDGGTAQILTPASPVTFPGLEPGTHAVLLSDVAVNCSVGGSSERSVTVVAGHTEEVTFEVGCVQLAGAIELRTTTAGYDLDHDGYVILVDGVTRGTAEVNGTEVLSGLTPGAHAVALEAIADNCTVVGENPVEVSVSYGETSPVELELTCAPLGRIAFDSDRAGASDIWAVDADGADFMNLTGRPEVQDWWPHWSPVGDRLAFSCDPYGIDVVQICLVDADGTGWRGLYDPYVWFEAWSPDGTMIAVTEDWLDVRGVDEDYEYATHSGGYLGEECEIGDAAWSPDGTTLAYGCGLDGNRVRIVTAPWERDTAVYLTSELEAKEVDLVGDWSPDGTRIAFTSNRTGSWDVYVINADGSGQVNLTDNPAADQFSDWSPDGTRIVFVRTSGDAEDTWYPPPGEEVFTINVDGTELRNLTDHPAIDLDPEWSPDGEKITFVTDRDGNWEVYVMKPDGSDAFNLTNHPAADTSPTWQPTP